MKEKKREEMREGGRGERGEYNRKDKESETERERKRERQ